MPHTDINKFDTFMWSAIMETTFRIDTRGRDRIIGSSKAKRVSAESESKAM